MKRAQVISLAVIIAIAAVIAYLALRNPQPPILPADPDHAFFESANPCEVCHGLDGGMPKSSNHPLGDDCTRCHGWPN